MQPNIQDTHDPNEVAKFDALAHRWWDKNGECKPLHAINPTRLAFIEQYTHLQDKRLLDIGCGGGILSEALAASGAQVMACDASETVIQVAKLHSQDNGYAIDYRVATTETLVTEKTAPFDIITCMELLEHVLNPKSLMAQISALLKPGGYCFLSTINRTVPAYLGAIVGAEYILRLLPKGTHTYQRFIRPAELSQWARAAGLSVMAISGMHYNPFTHQAKLIKRVSINYLMCVTKP